MKTLLTSLVLASLCASAQAAQTLGSIPFSDLGLRQVQSAAAAPSVLGAPQDRLSKGYLLAQSGKEVLFGYADTDAQFEEAVALWSAILSGAGITPGKATFKSGFYTIPYKTADGSVIRDFRAEPRQFKPKDDASLRDNRAMVLSALAQRQVSVLTSYVLDLEFLLPTYNVYYLVKPQARTEDESQVRVLKPGDDIDFELLRRAGLDILQTPEKWMMVYFGREVGYVSRIGKTREEIEKKVKERAEYLVSQGKVMIGTVIEPLTEPFEDYKFGAGLYFYQ
ncbi:MAG: hypothetical protein AAB320_01110 [Elusimicrobiota bacterium]